ncbi:MAG: ATP-binding cassette domain-containing protein [Bacilli bacterium]
MSLLSVSNLSKRFGSQVLFSGLSSDVDSGILLLKGASGCGKSTLINIILGKVSKDEGEIYIDNEKIDLLGKNKNQFIFSNISYCGTDPNLVYEMTLDENFRYLLNDIYDKQVRKQITDFFEFEKLEKIPLSELSGGERTKAELIFCLSKKRNIYILDEPFASLDTLNRDRLRDYIEKIKRHSLVIIVDHSGSMDDLYDSKIEFFENGKVEFVKKRITQMKLDRKGTTEKPKILTGFLSYFRSFKLDFFVRLFLLISSLACFIVGISFTVPINYVPQVNAILESDPIEYHPVSYKKNITPDSLFLDNSENKNYEVLNAFYYMNDGDRSGITFLTTKNEEINNFTFLVKDKTIGPLFGDTSFYEADDDDKKVTIIVNKLNDSVFFPDYIKTQLIIDEKKDSVLVVLNNYTLDYILQNGGVDKITVNNGNIAMPIGFKIRGNNLLLTTKKEDFIDSVSVFPDMDFLVSVKDVSAGREVKVYSPFIDDFELMSLISSSSQADTELSFSLRAYKDILLHANNINTTESDSVFFFLLNKEQIRKLDNVADYSFSDSLIKDYSRVLNVRRNVLFSLMAGLVVALIIYSFVSVGSLKKWKDSISLCFTDNGYSKRLFLSQNIVPIMIGFASSFLMLMLYYPCLLFADYLSVSKAFPYREGLYYYSQMPANNYYESLTEPLHIFSFNPFVFLCFAISLVYCLTYTYSFSSREKYK